MPQRICHATLLLAALGVAGCTTLTVEERGAACRATDWADYGYNDGILGVAAAERNKKFAGCAELRIPADVAAYQAGRAEGLKTYCTVENGYEVGYAGRRYRDVCPPQLAAGFLQGYEQGRKERPRRYYPYYGPGFGIGFGYGSFYYPYHRPHSGHRPNGYRRRSGGDGE